MKNLLRLVAMSGLALALGGCVHRQDSPLATTMPIATDIDPQTARPDYWLERPGVANVVDTDYRQLFDTCNHVIRQHRFEVDREDYRSGILSSKPMVSKQFWEFWRSDVGDGLANSSVATYRRTVTWTVVREGDSTFTATPRVVVERFSDEPRRVTSITGYRSAASSAGAEPRLDSPKLSAVGATRWYAVGRDEALERELAEEVRHRTTNQANAGK